MRTVGIRSATISTFGERHSACQWYAGFNEIYNLGQMGMAKALVGYLAATAGLKFEFDNLLVRGFLIAFLVLIHNGFLYVLTHQLLGLPAPFELYHLLASTLVNVALGLILFPLFDRFKMPT